MINSPCAILITPMRPKVMASPMAVTKRTEPPERPRNMVPTVLTVVTWPEIFDNAAAAAEASSFSPAAVASAWTRFSASWLGMEAIYGETGRDPRFAKAFAAALNSLWANGTEATLRAYIA